MEKEAEHRHLIWKTLGRIWLDDFKIFNIYRVERETTEGIRGSFFEVEAPDWVTIIPHITDPVLGDCFLMVRQYRHGNDSITVEFPAGMVEKSETTEASARRELLEETGYEIGSLERLGSVSPNPAFMSNTLHMFLAEDLCLVREQELDEHEFIDIVPVPVTDVIAGMGTGEYNNGIMMIALGFYLRSKGLIAAP